jgi:hypothetical protein
MEHAKKFVLVDPKFATPNIREKTLSGLDGEIDTILNSDVSDDVKARNYAAALRRHKNYSSFSSQTKPKPIEKLETEVLQSVAPAKKYKAKRLIKRLKQQKEVDWSSDGELIYRQQKIPKSNIVDLIDDVLKTKTIESPPPGYDALAAALKDAETPRDLVSNEARWNFMRGNVKSKRDKSARSKWIHY